jgi:tRNA-2-methylthio-N6-dimethylallyladenosine synthase
MSGFDPFDLEDRPPRTFFVETWGCQMNTHDTEKISGSLSRLGMSAADSENVADVVILNTCSVREKAQEKVFARLNDFVSLKRERPVVVGVAGCVAQQEGGGIFDRAPSVDFVLGTQSLVQLPEVLTTVVGTGERVVETGRHAENLDIPPEQIDRVAGVKAYITIMEGCDNFCTFCIVPYTRGRERCRPVDSIVREAEALARCGFREVQLLGQNVNSYRDPEDSRSFEELLDAVNEVEGLERIRFTSPHPKDFGEPMMIRFRDLSRLCPHMHLPAQSGSTSVLSRMNRGYSKEELLSKISRARELVPELAITTDLIVGFPGETDKDFDDTIDLLAKALFDNVYSFKYSERPLTHASKHQPDDVSEPVKKERLAYLQEFQKQIQKRKNESLIGTIAEVLVEGPSKTRPEILSGRSPDNRIVNFEGGGTVGALQPVRITHATPYSLFGSSETAAVDAKSLGTTK